MSSRVAIVSRLPMSRSPSQWPGTARSSASPGRSRMLSVDDLALAVHYRVAARPTVECSPQIASQFLQRAACLHEQGQVDRLVRHPHLRRRETRASASPISAAVTTPARASPRPLPATADTPPTSRPSGDELEPKQLDPPCTPDSAHVAVACDLPHDRRRRPTQPLCDRTARLTRRQPREISSRSRNDNRTANEPAPPAPAVATSGDDPRPSDGDDRSAHQSAGSATPSPRAGRSLPSHAPTTAPRHTSTPTNHHRQGVAFIP